MSTQVQDDSEVLLNIPPLDSSDDEESNMGDNDGANSDHPDDGQRLDEANADMGERPPFTIEDLLSALRQQCGDASVYHDVLSRASQRARPARAANNSCDNSRSPSPTVQFQEDIQHK